MLRFRVTGGACPVQPKLPALLVGPARFSPAAGAFGGTCPVSPAVGALMGLVQPAAGVIFGTCPIQPRCRCYL